MCTCCAAGPGAAARAAGGDRHALQLLEVRQRVSLHVPSLLLQTPHSQSSQVLQQLNPRPRRRRRCCRRRRRLDYRRWWSVRDAERSAAISRVGQRVNGVRVTRAWFCPGWGGCTGQSSMMSWIRFMLRFCCCCLVFCLFLFVSYYTTHFEHL